MSTPFAVRQDDGRYGVAYLEDESRRGEPRVASVVAFPPADSAVLDADTFARVKGSPLELRKAVIGTPSPMRQVAAAVHVHNPLARLDRAIESLGGAISDWREAGRRDYLSEGINPETLTNVLERLARLASRLEKSATRKAAVGAGANKRAELEARMRALGEALGQLSGARLQDNDADRVMEAFATVKRFCTDTGLAAGIEYSSQFAASGECGLGWLKREFTAYRISARPLA